MDLATRENSDQRKPVKWMRLIHARVRERILFICGMDIHMG